MPNYLARVVLHRLNSKGNDSSEDYSDLHTEMAKAGFEPAIDGFNESSRQPVRSALPGGLYYFDGKRTVNQNRFQALEEAYDGVDKAVSEVLKDESKYIRDANNPHSVFVIEAGESIWTGLKPAPMRGIQVRKAIFP